MFVGTWVASSQVPATLKFTGSSWTITVPSLNITEKGNYTFGSIDTYVFLNQDGSNAGQAVISGSTMTVHLSIPGPLNGKVFWFTKQ